MDAGIEYERIPGPWPKRSELMLEKTGVDKYPAIEFEDGTWYRDESKDMAETIRAGRLDQMHGKTPAAEASA